MEQEECFNRGCELKKLFASNPASRKEFDSCQTIRPLFYDEYDEVNYYIFDGLFTGGGAFGNMPTERAGALEILLQAHSQDGAGDTLWDTFQEKVFKVIDNPEISISDKMPMIRSSMQIYGYVRCNGLNNLNILRYATYYILEEGEDPFSYDLDLNENKLERWISGGAIKKKQFLTSVLPICCIQVQHFQNILKGIQAEDLETMMNQVQQKVEASNEVFLTMLNFLALLDSLTGSHNKALSTNGTLKKQMSSLAITLSFLMGKKKKKLASSLKNLMAINLDLKKIDFQDSQDGTSSDLNP